MERFGIKFFMKDGTVDYYDPIEKDDFQESLDAFILDMNYLYEIPREEVESFEWYNICDDCGHELIKGDCNRCIFEVELKTLKDGN
jgi:hypothetical protein